MEAVAERSGAAVERARAEAALREVEERFKRLVGSNIIGVLTADMKGVRTANDLYLEMIGASREDLEAGRVDWTRITPPEHLDRDMRAVEELRTKGWCSPYEKDYIHR